MKVSLLKLTSILIAQFLSYSMAFDSSGQDVSSSHSYPAWQQSGNINRGRPSSNQPSLFLPANQDDQQYYMSPVQIMPQDASDPLLHRNHATVRAADSIEDVYHDMAFFGQSFLYGDEHQAFHGIDKKMKHDQVREALNSLKIETDTLIYRVENGIELHFPPFDCVELKLINDRYEECLQKLRQACFDQVESSRVVRRYAREAIQSHARMRRWYYKCLDEAEKSYSDDDYPM